ncbi:calcitonin isoform X1 [Strix aluco]|uniref:calcitonin isoform X1 n=1 Tax=Strix aluco TaxID=111821 RepID=UPI003DA6202F
MTCSNARQTPRSCAWLSAVVRVLFILFCLPLLRPGLESITDRVMLSDYEARRLLNALVKEFIQMTAEELEQASEGNSLDRPISKRCASLSTCVLGKLSQELHKLQTYPRTDVGAGTPGKKRNVLSDLEHERYANYGEPLGNN